MGDGEGVSGDEEDGVESRECVVENGKIGLIVVKPREQRMEILERGFLAFAERGRCGAEERAEAAQAEREQRALVIEADLAGVPQSWRVPVGAGQ